MICKIVQNENKELNTNFQVTREQLAASQARVTTLEEQLVLKEGLCSTGGIPLDKESDQYKCQQSEHLWVGGPNQREQPVYPPLLR